MNILKAHKARLFENFIERKRKIVRRSHGGRILATKMIGDREVKFHATKGWRGERK